MNETEITKPEEIPKTRKKKFDPERMWATCRVCKEPGNLENLIYHKIPIKDKDGKVLHGCYQGLYFCSENCKGLFRG